jgi:hypothetical protein
MQTTPGSSWRLSLLSRMDDRTHLVGANQTGETFRKNVGQIFLHMLDSRDSEISSSEESLEGEPSWMAGGLPIRTTVHKRSRDRWGVERSERGFIYASNWEGFYLDCSNCPSFAMIRVKGAAFQRGITSRRNGRCFSACSNA